MAEPFRIIGPDEPSKPEEKTSLFADVGVQALMMGLGALSQRTIVALSRLFTLLTVGSAFWLWLSIPDPNTYQLIELAMYATFVLAANFIVRRA